MSMTWCRLEMFFKLFSILFVYFFQHCFICRPSNSPVSGDAGIEPTTLALAVRRSSNHSARSHPFILDFILMGILYISCSDHARDGVGLFPWWKYIFHLLSMRHSPSAHAQPVININSHQAKQFHSPSGTVSLRKIPCITCWACESGEWDCFPIIHSTCIPFWACSNWDRGLLPWWKSHVFHAEHAQLGNGTTFLIEILRIPFWACANCDRGLLPWWKFYIFHSEHA